jgi:predicted branched-subunit amino acid permease
VDRMTTSLTAAPSPNQSAGPLPPARGPDPGGRSTPPWRMAAVDVTTVASGMIAFGLVLGITIHTLGRDAAAGIIGAAGVYGGSAQLTTVTLLSQGSALLLAVLSGVVVNLRLLLYSAALGERFAGQPSLFRWLAPHLMIDQTFLMAQGRPQLTGQAFRCYWLWLGGLVLVVWCSSVTAGELLAPVLPPMPHLTLVCTAMFLGLLLPRLRSRPAVTAALTGFAAAAVVSQLVPELGIAAGAVCGVTAAMSRRQSTSTASS